MSGMFSDTLPIIEEIARLDAATNVDVCFAAGYDCGKNGITPFNAHFRFFKTEERMKAWERGKKMAEEEA